MKVISLRIEYLRLKQISQEDKHILYSQRDSELATFSVASIRQPDPQSMLRKLRPRACSARFVPVMKMQISRDFPLSQKLYQGWYIKKKAASLMGDCI